jgi:hypothetical protein
MSQTHSVTNMYASRQNKSKVVFVFEVFSSKMASRSYREETIKIADDVYNVSSYW